MGFKKGNTLGGRTKGSKSIKTAQWDSIGEFLVNEGSQKYLEHVKSLAENDPQKYTEEFLKILEYFKPKRARENGDGETQAETVINVVNYKQTK